MWSNSPLILDTYLSSPSVNLPSHSISVLYGEKVLSYNLALPVAYFNQLPLHVLLVLALVGFHAILHLLTGAFVVGYLSFCQGGESCYCHSSRAFNLMVAIVSLIQSVEMILISLPTCFGTFIAKLLSLAVWKIWLAFFLSLQNFSIWAIRELLKNMLYKLFWPKTRPHQLWWGEYGMVVNLLVKLIII